MDIRVKAVKQSEAPEEAFGSYRAQVNNPSTLGRSLTNIGKQLDQVKQKKQKESDLLTADRIHSDYMADLTIAKNKLASKDLNVVKEGMEELSGLDPDSFDFNAYGASKNLAPLYDENSFAKYKNRARQAWEIENALAGSREADRHRATGIKAGVNSYIQTNADNLDPLKMYSTDFVEQQIDYFKNDTYSALDQSADEAQKPIIDQSLTESLVNVLKHNLTTAKTPDEYNEAVRLFNLAKDEIPVEKFKDEFVEEFSTAIQKSYKRTHDIEYLEANLGVELEGFKNSLAGIKSTVGIDVVEQGATVLLERSNTIKEKYEKVIDKTSTDYLLFESNQGYLDLYTKQEDGTSVYFKVLHAHLAGEPVSFGQITQALKSKDASRFEDHVKKTATELKSRLKEGDLYAFTLIDSKFAKIVSEYRQGNITPSQFSLEYKTMAETYDQIPGLVVPKFSAKNRVVETFSAKRGDVEAREAYINEAVEVNRYDPGLLFTQSTKAEGDEKFLLTVAASSLVNGVDPSEKVQNFNRLLNVGSNVTSENTPKLDLFIEYVAANNLESELGNFVRTYSLEKQDMSDTYQTLQNGVVASYVKANPDASMKEVYSHLREIEEDMVNSFGYVRNVNGRNTFVIPQLITDDISTSLGGGFMSEKFMESASAIAGPYQLYTNKLLQTEGVRMVEASLSVELAVQMSHHTDAFLAKLESAGVNTKEVMPDVYTAKSVTARAKAFMFSEVNGKPMVSYDEVGVENGVPGYYPRFQGKAGEYTIYAEDVDGKKLFIPYTKLEGMNDAIKTRQINVGLFDDSPDTPLTLKATAGAFDLFSSFFMRNNRFLNEALDFREIAR